MLSRKVLSVAAVMMVAPQVAFAGDVASKCEDAMNSVGAENVEDGCACFEESLSADEASEYLGLELSEWDNASASLKEAGAKCFPDDNTNG